MMTSRANRYRGHHSRALGDHVCAIDIAVPSADIFPGKLELSATGIVHLQDDASPIIRGVKDSLPIRNADTGKEIDFD
jgi:hypothetical protein